MAIQRILFVHGTGVRKASFEATAARLLHGLKDIGRGDLRLEPCLWGDTLGARLGRGGISIPNFEGEKPATPAESQELALWALLAADPMFELRELAAAPSGALVSPAQAQRKQALPAKLRGLGRDTALLARLGATASAAQWAAAVDAVADDAALKAALAAAARVDTPLRVACAHAVLATLARALQDALEPVPDAARRDELVEQCIAQLGGRELGIKDWIQGRLVGLALNWATNKARREREALFSAAYPAAGDILLYQARGAAIREFIASRAADCGPGTAIVAHSLGGIACVDTLVERELPQVELLVTVGSQAPFLYEIGALSQLACGEPLPAHFPRRWLNFYDLNDLLSYRAAPLFTGIAVDYRVASGQPFPLAHSAYWSQPTFWQVLGKALAA